MLKTYMKYSLIFAAFLTTAACTSHPQEPLFAASRTDRDVFCDVYVGHPLCKPPQFTLAEATFFFSKGYLEIKASRPIVEAWGESVSVTLEQNMTFSPLDVMGGEIEDHFFLFPNNVSSGFRSGSANLRIDFQGSDGTVSTVSKVITLDASSGL